METRTPNNPAKSKAERQRQFNYLLERISGPDHDEEVKLTTEQSFQRYLEKYPEPLEDLKGSA